MRHLATTLIAVATLLLPVLSALGHLETELSASLGDREIVVTGHDERDPALHIEAPSGVVVVRCPECVLDKRQSSAPPQAGPTESSRASGRRFLPEEAPSLSCELSPHASPRAPPLV